MTKITRLLENFAPNHYEISLDLSSPTELKFTGNVIITGISQIKSRTIKLHSKNLKIHKICINSVKVDNWKVDGDELVIMFPTNINDELILDIHFSGDISNSMHGLYCSTYKYENKKHLIYATQFESHHAREVFPCIDEPAAKAKFELQIISKTDKTVLSNMTIVSQTEFNSKLITQFDTSPIMSTYLLAFIVGDLNKITTKTKTGIEVSVFSSLAHSSTSLQFALETAKESLEFYENYFNIDYPLPKLDNVALPDFSAGAMENWGLVTYRESLLIADKATTLEGKRHIAKTIAHEIAHQWFGNLVTMKWWNDLWLNESFATFMEYHCVNKIYPEMKIWDDFNKNETFYALKRDCYYGVQPVRVDVNHPDEISTLFDSAIVYAKGSRLLKMLSSLVGEDSFRSALTSYFIEYKYKNTEASDLWRSIAKKSNLDVESIMSTWLDQPGYPILTVQKTENRLELNQRRFLIGSSKPTTDQTWKIPIDSSSHNLPKIFDKKTEVFEYAPTENSPIIFNHTSSSHFITNYSDELFDDIVLSIEIGKISDNFVAQFIHEQSMLYKESLISSKQIINLVRVASKSTSPNVWHAINIVINDLRSICMSDENTLNSLRKLCDDISNDIYDIIGITPAKDEDQDISNLRDIILDLKLFAKNTSFISHAIAMFNSHNQNPHAINPEIRMIVLKTVIKYHENNKKIFDNFVMLYPSETNPDVKHDLLHAICSTRNKSLINKLINMFKNESFIRHQDLLGGYVRLLANKRAKEIAWQWLQMNWMWIYKILASDKSAGDYARYTANLLFTKKQYDEYKLFFEPKKNIVSLKRDISIGVNEIKHRVKRIDSIYPDVKSALDNLYPRI